MIHTAGRAMLLSFGVMALLLGTMLLAAGAFRPVRFVTARLPVVQRFHIRLNAFFPDGRMVPFMQSGPGMLWDHSSSSRMSWISYEAPAQITVWENGKRTVIEGVASDTLWSPSGMFAWWQYAPENNLQIWDGETIRGLTTSAEQLLAIAWTADNQLWWVQKSWNSAWELMLWDGQNTTILYSTSEGILNAQFFACGAVQLVRPDGMVIYQLSERRLLSLPSAFNASAGFLTDTCRTFFLLNTTEERPGKQITAFWDGTAQRTIPFEVVRVRGDDTLLGVEQSDDDFTEWTLIYSQPGKRQEQVIQADRPVLLGWNQAASFWWLTRPNDLAQLLIWNMETGDTQVYRFTHPSYASFNTAPDADRTAWVEAVEPPVIRLGLWDNETMTHRSLTLSDGQTDSQLGEMRWMNDGSLLLTLYPNLSNQFDLPGSLYLYHWEEDRLERVGSIPASTFGFSDWMTWE